MVIPSRSKAKFRTKTPGRANRRDLQAQTYLGAWIRHPLSRQLFGEVRHGGSILKLVEGKYVAAIDGTIL